MAQASQTSDAVTKSKISAYWELWIEGLAAALLWAGARFSRDQYFEMRTHLRRLTLFRKEGSIVQPVFSKNIGAPDRIPEALLQTTRNGIIEIVVPEAAVVERQLDALPAESRPYVENVVLHQIESIFPWRASDILYSTKIEKRNDGMLNIRVWATSRTAIKDELALAQEAGVDEAFITSDKAQSGILAFIGPRRGMRLNKARLIARYAVLSGLILCIGVVGWTLFERWSLVSDVAALNDTIAERQSLLKRGSGMAGSRTGRGLGEKKALTPPTVVVLEELSAILPDNTYLTDLSLEGTRVRITGVSANAVSLPALLENSGLFKNVSFYAPTTRIDNGTADRFSIEASLALQQESIP